MTMILALITTLVSGMALCWGFNWFIEQTHILNKQLERKYDN